MKKAVTIMLKIKIVIVIEKKTIKKITYHNPQIRKQTTEHH